MRRRCWRGSERERLVSPFPFKAAGDANAPGQRSGQRQNALHKAVEPVKLRVMRSTPRRVVPRRTPNETSWFFFGGSRENAKYSKSDLLRSRYAE
jgi:hypothetical protein